MNSNDDWIIVEFLSKFMVDPRGGSIFFDNSSSTYHKEEGIPFCRRSSCEGKNKNIIITQAKCEAKEVGGARKGERVAK
jgi:hypothetical protein